MISSPEIVICGAGIAGISAAYHLAVQHGLRDTLIIDQSDPLSLTSDKSTECYRNWWPGPGDAMVALMNRSIDLMEDLARQSNNVFHLSRRGYLYVTAKAGIIPGLLKTAAEISSLGAGPLRVYQGGVHDPLYQPSQPHGYAQEPSGADLILDPALLQQHFPYLTGQAVAALHVRRAGWFSAQQLGAYLLDQARKNGVELWRARIAGVEVHAGRVQAVLLEDGRRIETRNFVNASGPMLKQVGRMLGVDLPVFSELHLKAAINERRRIIPRHAPLLIWTDTQRLPWSAEEQQLLREDPDMAWLLDEFPAGAHTRPEGGDDSSVVLMLWEYCSKVMEPIFPLPLDPHYPEIVLRGLITMLPGLQVYLGHAGRPWLDGGYYIKTRENRPLIGPLPVEGAYIIGALSGFGLMAACAAGELLALHLTGGPLPAYAPAFSPERYQDPGYIASLENPQATGQL